MIRVSDLSLSFTSGGTRTVRGTRDASTAVTGASSTTLPSSAWMARSPKLACFSAGQTSSSALAGNARAKSDAASVAANRALPT